MNQALCKLFLSLVSPETQRTFEEEMMANPNMKFKDMADNFRGTYGRVTEEEVKDNKDRLTTSGSHTKVSKPLSRKSRPASSTATLPRSSYLTGSS